MTRKLRDLEIEEISLVDKAATGRSFMIIKSMEVTNTMEELEKLIKEFNPEGHEIDILRKAKDKLPKDMLDELTKAYKALVKYKGDLPSDLKAGIDILLKFLAVSYGLPGKEGAGKKKLAKGIKYWPSFDFDGNGQEAVEKINKEYQGDPFPSITKQLLGTEEEGEEDNDED